MWFSPNILLRTTVPNRLLWTFLVRSGSDQQAWSPATYTREFSLYQDESSLSVSDLTGRKFPVTKLTMPAIFSLQSRNGLAQLVQLFEIKVCLTSVYQKNFDSKIGIADAKQDDFVSLIELKKVIPQIANQ